jgi:hypothetical protein
MRQRRCIGRGRRERLELVGERLIPIVSTDTFTETCRSASYRRHITSAPATLSRLADAFCRSD